MKYSLAIRRLKGLRTICAALLSACLLPSAMAAQYSVRTEVRILDSLTQQEIVPSNRPVTTLSFDTLDVTVGNTRASAMSWADTAGLHFLATSKSEVVGGKSLVYSDALADGSFRDDFVLSSPNHSFGTIGSARVAFAISGNLAGMAYSGGDALGGNGYARWRANFSLSNLSGQTDGVRWEGWQSRTFDVGGELNDGTAMPGVLFFDLPVVFGADFRLEISAGVEARSGAVATLVGPGSAGGEASAAFFNTLAWGGIVSLADANGAAITDFTALSAETGFDYSRAYISPVPEPAPVTLLLTGGLVLTLVVRRRQRSA